MSSPLIKIDKSYRNWIQEACVRFRRSQIRAAVKVNDELLRFYWSLGRDISSMRLDAKHGSDFFRTLSKDLQELLPDVRSFSPTNLKYMRYFYEMYPRALDRRHISGESEGVGNRQQVADDLETADKSLQISEKTGLVENRQQVADDLKKLGNRQQLVDDLGDEVIFYIPWGHHMLLLGKCKGDPDKAAFYVRKTLENNWSRAVLAHFLETDLYERQGKAVSNFALTLPAPQSDLAQAITKDPYCFDFLTIREKYDEKELKDAMMANAEKFLLELGNGFALMGREVRLEIGDTEKFIDLLFYNARLHCYVVVEVKTTEFDSSYSGQLGTYVVAVNHQLKTEQDAPTIGLLICKNMDRVEAQYALESSSQPLGVSSYKLSKLVPEEFRSSLPSIEEIETELGDVEETETQE